MKRALLQESIGSAAARHPMLRNLLETLGLDYYCEGQLTIEEACRGAAIDVDAAWPLLAEAAAGNAGVNWQDAPLTAVTSYLQGEHHAVTRGVLFRIGVLFTEACRASNDHRLAAMRTAFRRLAETIVAHMEREELTIFPAIVALEEAWTRSEPPPARFEGGIRAVAGGLALEHSDINRRLTALREMRDAMGESEGGRYSPLFDELDRLERHIHEYMNLETYVAFPRAIALEEALRERTLEAV